MVTKFEKLTVSELKHDLLQAAKRSRETMSPLLYYLRERIKRPGSRNDRHQRGEGFGQWVEKNLQITRRTADMWANEWAMAQGLKKPRTSGKNSQGARPELAKIVAGPGMVVCNLSLRITEAKEDDVLKAWALLGDDEVTEVVCNSLIESANRKCQTPRDAFKLNDLGELQGVDISSQKKPPETGPTSRLTFLEDGQA